MPTPLELELRAPAEQPGTPWTAALVTLAPFAPRPLSAGATAFVIDASGSMRGAPLELAARALRSALATLHPDERVTVVRFGSAVETLCAGLRPEEVRARLFAPGMEGALQATLGGTNLYAGWHAAVSALASAPAGAHRRVLLMTDGQVNEGVRDRATLSGAARTAAASGVVSHYLGLGVHYDQALLLTLAQAAGGVFDHARGEAQLPAIFSRQLADTAGEAEQVTLSLVWPGAVELLGADDLERRDQAWVLRLRPGERRELLVRLALGAESGERTLRASLETSGITASLSQTLRVGDLRPGEQVSETVEERLRLAEFRRLQLDSLEAARRGDLQGAGALLREATLGLSALRSDVARGYQAEAAGLTQALSSGAASYTYAATSAAFNLSRGRVALEPAEPAAPDSA